MILFNYKGVLALKANWLWGSGGVMSERNYYYHCQADHISVLQRGCRYTEALVSYESLLNLPYHLVSKIEQRLRDLKEFVVEAAAAAVPALSDIVREGVSGIIGGNDAPKVAEPCFFEGYIKPDAKAMEFFNDGGLNLTPVKRSEYYINVQALNAFDALMSSRMVARNAKGPGKVSKRGEKHVFKTVYSDFKKLNKDKFPHTLPGDRRNFRPKYLEYSVKYKESPDEAYRFLLHGNTGNINSRIVTDRIEHLLLSIAAMSTNPYDKWVHEYYTDFLDGKKSIINSDTGEIYNRDDFKNADGSYLHVSVSTVYNYINKPDNKVIIQKIRNKYRDFRQLYSPHTVRSAPVYSLSKVSIDDYDLPRSLDGGGHLYAYYAFDVMSGAVIGAAHSDKKDSNLLLNCLRDMYRNLDTMGLGWPLEIETENHLARDFKDTIFKAGNLFPIVRFCAPSISQEKHAEHFIRRKRYGFEKQFQENIGRHYARLDVNRATGDRFYNEKTNEYEYKWVKYSYKRLEEDDKLAVKMYNESLHRDQENHRGETLLDALKKHANPDACAIDKKSVYYWLGNKDKTSISRNQYVELQYKKYWLSSPEVLSKLKPNSYDVLAYWMYDAAGIPSQEAFIFQDDRFICKVSVMQPFSTSHAERTRDDLRAMGKQMSYITGFKNFIKRGFDTKISDVRIIDSVQMEEYGSLADSPDDYIVCAAGFEAAGREQEQEQYLEELFYDHDPEEARKRALSI